MDIPMNAEVHCADGYCGRCSSVVIDPATDRVTHLVVRERRSPHHDRLVDIDQVLETTPHLIQLRCTSEELAAKDNFVETEYFWIGDPVFPHTAWDLALGNLNAEPLAVPVSHEQIPVGELAVRRGTRVEAVDGHLGQFDEFRIDPESGQITHLIVLEGRLWARKEVAVPISDVARIEEDAIYLRLDKQSVESLPAVPLSVTSRRITDQAA